MDVIELAGSLLKAVSIPKQPVRKLGVGKLASKGNQGQRQPVGAFVPGLIENVDAGHHHVPAAGPSDRVGQTHVIAVDDVSVLAHGEPAPVVGSQQIDSGRSGGIV